MRLMKNEKGFGFIEVLIALALLGIIGIGLLGGLATASQALFTTDERATAESLARNQMEYVKNQPYANSYTPDAIPVGTDYDGYSVVDPIPGDSIPGQLLLQKVTVTIMHHGKTVMALEGYKASR